jgi:hypothetical protein
MRLHYKTFVEWQIFRLILAELQGGKLTRPFGIDSVWSENWICLVPRRFTHVTATARDNGLSKC